MIEPRTGHWLVEGIDPIYALNGYEHYRDQDALMQAVAEGRDIRRCRDIDALRAHLFFAARAAHHTGIDDETGPLPALLRIRELLLEREAAGYQTPPLTDVHVHVADITTLHVDGPRRRCAPACRLGACRHRPGSAGAGAGARSTAVAGDPMKSILLLVLVLAGCAGGPRPAGPDVAGLRARLGSAEVFAASLLVQLTPQEGGGELFSLRLWRAADGAVRLRAQKLDVDFLDALVRADRSYEAWLPRERVATAGKLGSVDDPPLLRDLQLLLGDLRDGPLPRTAVPAGDARQLTWIEAGWSAELDLAADGLPVAKRLVADGVVQREVTYARWQAHEGLMRPGQVRLRVAGDGGVTAIRLKSPLDTPAAISPERMALRIAEGVERVEPAEFSRRMLP